MGITSMNFVKKLVTAAILAAFSYTIVTKAQFSYAFFANNVASANSSAVATVDTGEWDIHTTGTAITTPAQFRTYLMNPSSQSGTFYLANNLDFSSVGSISKSKTKLYGILYGNGFVISNVTMTNATRGLIYAIGGGTIDNLILKNITVGSSNSRVNDTAGILVGASNGTGSTTSTISKIRIYDSAVYCSNAYGAGAVIGSTGNSDDVNISDVFVGPSSSTVTVYNSNTSAGGIIGRVNQADVTVKDVYVQASITASSYAGGIVGNLASTTPVSTIAIDRAVVYGTTYVYATTNYAAGAIGYTTSTGTNTISNFLVTGQIRAASGATSLKIGLIYTGTDITSYSNCWFSEVTSTNRAITSLLQYSATYYVSSRASLTTVWWKSNLPNISSNMRWTYDISTYLYKMKP